MKSQHTSQNDAEGHSPWAPGTDLAGGATSADAERRGDPQELAQAVRAVMHPELHEPEWRYVHGATQGAAAVTAQG
jgi:hypothetical protein